MGRPDPIPHAVSFRQLEHWRQHASNGGSDRDPASGEGCAIPSQGSGAHLEQLLNQYEQLSQELLNALARQAESLRQQRSGEQLLALGALNAHLRLSLQALAASRR